MDPMDEFEFKPLTDGLGFHKKKLDLKKEVKSSGLVSDKLTKSIPSVPQNILEEKKSPATNKVVDDVLKTLNDRRQKLDFQKTKEKKINLNEEIRPEFKPARWNMTAAVMDTMIVLAFYLVCLIDLLLVTQVDLIANIISPDPQYMIYASMGGLLIAIAWIYQVTFRSFLGYTPGEWVFDLKLGDPTMSMKKSYDMKVVLRSLVVIFTGFITLPILSIIFRRDIAGDLTGLRLMKKN